MIKLNYEQIMEKLEEKSGLSKEELEAKVKQKLEQLSGLVSKDGAAHIVANELGINLFEEFTGKVKIEKLLNGMRNVEVLGKVQAVWDLREFTNQRGEGKVQSMLIGDETGMCRVTCWHAATEKLNGVKEDDTVLVKNALVRENNGRLELHCNDKSEIKKNPEGEKVEKVAERTPIQNSRKKISELNENDQNVELLGAIVQMFDPRFFEVCPECGKRARLKEENYVCEAHGNVKPDYSYVLNAVLDDGTETIRCVFFRQQAEKLMGETKEGMMKYKEEPETFETTKKDLLGQMVKIGGRATKNAMFDRTEFIAREVDTNPDPEKEIEREKKELEA